MRIGQVMQQQGDCVIPARVTPRFLVVVQLSIKVRFGGVNNVMSWDRIRWGSVVLSW